MKVYHNIESGLSPIIKWKGGKEKELKYIIPNVPHFKRFIDPFVGGGSVFMGIKSSKYIINDFSSELIELYRCIESSDKDFFKYTEMMDLSWINAVNFFQLNPQLKKTYIEYRDGLIGKNRLKEFIHSFCLNNKNDILNIIDNFFVLQSCILLEEMEINLFRKMVRMKELDIKKNELSDEGLNNNIETAIKSAVYMNYRNLYNSKDITEKYPKLHCALFFFIRNYSYGGMFRYSTKGEFNVPYGGIAYNNKLLKKKLSYYKSKELLKHFEKTTIYNLDFEEFLRKINPCENDFVFLDPPYDSKFNTYAQNTFTRNDQQRLANYFINECKAKWMLIIKNTDFIYNLYNKKGINIRTFDKKYAVNFMNRNDKKVTHLLITNY